VRRLFLAVAAAAAFSLSMTACGTTQHWPMPNLVGSNLQDAQNRIQDLTGNAVETNSHDATPLDREQTVDRDWKVCQQSVKPGDQITEEDTVDFVVVKNEEKC
jgi:beta-lactam-binding protein with PASTA domain